MAVIDWIIKISTVVFLLSMLAHKLVLADEKILDGLKETFCVQDNMHRMVSVAYKGTEMTHCSRYGDKHVINMLLKAIPKDTEVHFVNSKIMDTLMEQCSSKEPHIFGFLFDVGEHFRHWIGKNFERLGSLIHEVVIYPGTKWCGPGNVASGYGDLGTHAKADACCRQHDHCHDSIQPFRTKHGLKNPNLFVKSNCRCDDKFYNCLQKANTKTSNRIGDIYFNDIKQPCFKKDHPCLHPTSGDSLATGFMKICKQSPLDRTEKPVWEYFGAKQFDPLTTDE